MQLDSKLGEQLKLAPHSGIQFLNYGFNLVATPRFKTREFFGRKLVERANAAGKFPMKLLPAWNEDEPDVDPPFRAEAEDHEYSISREKSLETFLNRWMPIPYLSVRSGLDEMNREIFDKGPINWARMRVSVAEPSEEVTHHVVLAFDTEIRDHEVNRYTAPTPENVRNEQEFFLASRFADVDKFVSTLGPGADLAKGGTSWVDRWLFEIFVASREKQLNRRVSDDEKATVEHIARYITLLQFLSETIAFPRIRLIDTYSDVRRIRPVTVDLVLDVGNSRTCGVLLESYPNEAQAQFANTLVLGLRDLGAPHRIYQEPFESHVELSQANFGSIRLSREVSPYGAFFWPSPVRVGPEAARFRTQADGGEATSGMSSPKRYLCDTAAVNQPWRFQSEDYDGQQNPPPIDARIRLNVNRRGDVNRQAAVEPKLYSSLNASSGGADGTTIGIGLNYSKSSMFTFMLTEIIAQTMSMINNPQVRKSRRDSDAPRELRHIFLSLPTAMPIQEQRIMRSRAAAAVKLFWDLMKWTDYPPKNLLVPEVRVAWDEATCTQMVYLYSEIVDKFGGKAKALFDLLGRLRPFSDPENPLRSAPATDSGRSLRIASVDVGGGTTDLMVTTYHLEGDHALLPIQNFREGFRIAGDDVLREVIQLLVLPPIEKQLRLSGIASPREFLNARFGVNLANMKIQEQHLRREFVLTVLQPAALAILGAVERQTRFDETREVHTLRELLGGTLTGANIIPDRVRNYVEEEARKWGAKDFSLESCPIPIDASRVRNAVSSVLGGVFDNISEAINNLDCDVVLLSGRPTRLQATIDLFINKLAVTPDRVVPLSRYQVGRWYPFASGASLRIEDPKTATVVGCLLCVMVGRQIENFTINVERFSMRSTAKYIGVLDLGGKLDNSNVLFSWDDDPKASAEQEAKLQYRTTLRLGYRQLPIERWTATPLYRLKFSASSERVALPLTVTMKRVLPTDAVELASKTLSIAELVQRQAQIEAGKEELTITEVSDRDGGGGGMKRMLSLTLDTLPSNDGYWLDTGILTVG